jgi:hypothetical protein
VPSAAGGAGAVAAPADADADAHPTSHGNVRVYNDLALLEEQLEGNAQAITRAGRRGRPPEQKTSKYYKD